jgi:hypothetical protein
MNTLDNLHRTNQGASSFLSLSQQPMEYSSTGTSWIKQNVYGGAPGAWDHVNRAPRPLSIYPVDPFNRVHLGKDVPGQEMLTSVPNSYIPMGIQPVILPGGSAESWVMYQQTHRPKLFGIL